MYSYVVVFTYSGTPCVQYIDSNARPDIAGIEVAESAVKKYIEANKIQISGFKPTNIVLIPLDKDYKDWIKIWKDFSYHSI